MTETEELVVTFLEHDPGEPCGNSRWDCPNEAVWEYLLHGSCSCAGIRFLCDPCKVAQEELFGSWGMRIGACNSHGDLIKASHPVRIKR